MCDGMNINRRLLLIGIMLVVLSMTMATQYTSTRITYRYSIVHPSDADLRFIASDNSSDDIKILRIVGGNASGDQRLELVLGGNISTGQNKTYTAAFGIVNEEKYSMNITNIEVATSDTDYMQIWLHGDRDSHSDDDASAVKVWDKGTMGHDNSSSVWVLAAGDGLKDTMSADGTTQLDTPWDSTANVRWSSNNNNDSVSGTSDFVWAQVSLDLTNTSTTGAYSGSIFVFTRAGT
jgi:hypothetical protein